MKTNQGITNKTWHISAPLWDERCDSARDHHAHVVMPDVISFAIGLMRTSSVGIRLRASRKRI